MDMPITVPRASVTESLDDLKARDMVLCRFPEVDMVVGKAGRAETPTDPAPLDMIETMVNFRPREFWPRRKLRAADAERQTRAVLDALLEAGPHGPAGKPGRAGQPDPGRRSRPPCRSSMPPCASTPISGTRDSSATPGPRPPRSIPPIPPRLASFRRWRAHVAALDGELLDRAAPVFTRIAIEQLLERAPAVAPEVAAHMKSLKQVRAAGWPWPPGRTRQLPPASTTTELPPGRSSSSSRRADLEAVHKRLSDQFSRRLLLWKIDREELAGFGGELDRAVQMPGWTNVWTMPIQNRVDMLATGVNTTIGIRVLGREHGRRGSRIRGDRRRGQAAAGRRGRGGRPDPGQALSRDPLRPRPRRPAGRERRRGQPGDRGGARGEAGHVRDRGSRAAPGGGPLRAGLPRGRGVRARPAGHGADRTERRRARVGSPGSARRGRRRPGRRRPGHDQGRERPVAQLRAAQRARSRRGRLRGRSPRRCGPRGHSARGGLPRVDRPVRAPASRAANADASSSRSSSS